MIGNVSRIILSVLICLSRFWTIKIPLFFNTILAEDIGFDDYAENISLVLEFVPVDDRIRL